MSDIYDVNLTGASPTIAQQLLPVDKRANTNVQLLQTLFSPLQWVRDLWLGTYRLGDTSTQWSSTTTYNQYDRVQYQKQVWESLQGSNTNNLPIIGTTYWQLVQPNFIGLSERLMYNGQCIVLTSALNKWFGTTCRPATAVGITQVARNANVATITATAHGYTTGQWVNIQQLNTAGFNGVYQITVVNANTFTCANTGTNVSTTTDTGYAIVLSDIFIKNNALFTNPFVVASVEGLSSIVFSGTSQPFILNTYTYNAQYNFTIYVPIATYNALDASMQYNAQIFGAFAAKYIPSGILYNIQTY